MENKCFFFMKKLNKESENLVYKGNACIFCLMQYCIIFAKFFGYFSWLVLPAHISRSIMFLFKSTACLVFQNGQNQKYVILLKIAAYWGPEHKSDICTLSIFGKHQQKKN